MAFGSMAPEIYYDPMTGLPVTQPEVPPADVAVVPNTQGPVSRALGSLAGTNFGQPRFQTWPEKLARSAFTLPGDVMSGEQPMLPPGLRREDYTDVPAPMAPTEDSTWLGRATGIAPVAAQPNDPAYERAQDTAGIAGGGMVFGGLARPAMETGVRVLGRQIMSDAASPGAPLAALEAGKALAVERRNKGWNTGKMAEGHDFRRPDPVEEFDRLHATARGAYEAQRPAPESPLMTPDDRAFMGSGRFLEDSAVTGAPLSALEKGPAGAYHGLLDQPPSEAYKPSNAPEAQPAAREAPPATGGRDVAGGAGGGDAGLAEAQAAAARRAGAHQPLTDLPAKAMKIGDEHFVPGPIASVKDVAAKYMADRPKSSFFKEPDKYHPHDPEHGAAIAQAFEEMKHAPNDPAVKNSYKAMVDETLAQYRAIKESGLKIEAIPDGMPDPYAKNPRLAAKDVADNNHLWFFPTDQGFGSGGKIDLKKHPMMQKTGEKLGDRELLANDVFRVVHDYFGHLKEGHGFRAGGEDNAWRSHASMYSDLARPAMTTETRGQNSWVNFGPHGEKNRTASGLDTVYADQKVGLMPDWTMLDKGASPTEMYHGSAADYLKPDLSKMGTGQGEMAYGAGYYGSKKEKVAKRYRDMQANYQLERGGKPASLQSAYQSMDDALGIMGVSAGKREHVTSTIADLMEAGYSTSKIRGMVDRVGMEKEFDAALKVAGEYKINKSPGHLYKWAIDAPTDRMLDWDKPFSKQPVYIQEKLNKHVEESVATQKAALERGIEKAKAGKGFGSMVRQQRDLEQMERKLAELNAMNLSGRDVYKRMGLPASDQAEAYTRASQRLKEMGIPAVTYKDVTSTAGDGGARNFVVFDDSVLRLLRKYAVPGVIGGGATFGSMARDDK